jgi:hypothetical protein
MKMGSLMNLRKANDLHLIGEIEDCMLNGNIQFSIFNYQFSVINAN